MSVIVVFLRPLGLRLVGDTIEFPDSPPMVNFQSKTLKRTFDKIIFAPGLAVNK